MRYSKAYNFMVKILYLNQYFSAPTIGPGGMRAYELASHLLAAGYKITMLTSSASLGDAWAPSSGWHAHEIDGIQVEVLRLPYNNSMPFRERITVFLKFAWRAAWHVRKFDTDLVFASSTPLTIAIPALVAKFWHRVPLVFEVCDLWPELPIAVGALRDPVSKGMARLLEWLVYHASAHVVALSPGMAEGVMCRGIPAARVTVIPNSSDVELFDVPPERGNAIRTRLGLATDQPLIIYAGAFGLINGVGYLVELAAATREIAPEARFLLVGQGAEVQKVTQRARELGVLNHNLWIWDAIPKTEIPDLLAAATVATSVFIPLRPMWHNSANKFFDALAARKPVAINYGGWQADLLHETGAGIVLPPENLDEAARLLADFARDSDRLQQASAAARDLAYTRFARDALAAQLEAVLRGVVERG